MIYEQGHVKIDSHFARFGSKSYAIDKINSVDVREEKRSAVAFTLFAIMAVLAGLAALGATGSGETGSVVTTWVLFLILAGIAVVLYKNRPTPIYHLVLATSSGEVQATKTGDQSAIGELRGAIELAMTQRP